MYDLAIKNGKIYRNGRFENADLFVRGGRFAHIGQTDGKAKETIDAAGLLVLPGLIDPHVHFALDLGTRKSADDFYSGSLCAAFGGVTTIIDFLDPTDNSADLEKAYFKRLKEAEGSVVDFQFHATLKNPKGNLEAYVQKVAALGMTSVKLFTTYSDSGRRTYDPDIKELLRLSEKYGILVEAHIENDDMIRLDPADTYADLGQSRPLQSETTEALKLAGFVQESGGTLYMVHLSGGETLQKLKETYPELLNKRFFVESCPQYFLLNEKRFQASDGYLYTMAPPLRSEESRRLLCGLVDDVFAIGTDHCPFTKAEKNHMMLRHIPLGIGGVEHAFVLLYKEFSDRIIDKMTKNTAQIQNLADKGEIQIGKDADLCLFRPDPQATITTNHSRGDYDVYQGFPAGGTVVSTILRGHFVVKDGAFAGGTGKLVSRGRRK